MCDTIREAIHAHIYMCASLVARKKIEYETGSWVIVMTQLKNRTDTLHPTIGLDIRNDWRTMTSGYANTHMYKWHFRALCIRIPHIYTRSCIYLWKDSGESADQMQRQDEIALASRDSTIVTRGDSIYIRNFCSLMANIRASRIYTRIVCVVNSQPCGWRLHSRKYLCAAFRPL